MFKKLLLFLVIGFSFGLSAQEINSSYKTKKILATRDTIRIENNSINSAFFKLLDANQTQIDSTLYHVDFQKGFLIFNQNYTISPDSITIRYQKLPDYLTKEYSIYDSTRIVSNESGQNGLYRISSDAFKKPVPFEGLNTSGSISRGITVGNYQNSVVNSNLDLQITGKISDKVSLRASIQDSNIPLQSGGYSQNLDEFDQIFIELFSDRWNIRAGDLFLENRKSRFLNFNKKVQGLSANINFGKEKNKTNVFASAALVKGQYARSAFVGQEGNQGPYKLTGSNGELYVLVISGSERVYVNGILLQRGENNDYTIDYNAGEIRFTSLFPITSEMRINIEYQFSDRNYTRFVTYFGASHEAEKWSIGANFYSENDLKNQPLQQTLSEEQAQILVNAGDNPALMTAPSAYLDTYAENKILYRKALINGVEVFQYSADPTEVLYNVHFSLVGANQGNYSLSNAAAVGKIYSYVDPVDGQPRGNYEPIIRLVPPTKIEIATVMGKYNPSEKTAVDFELGISNNDLNLFSPNDDSDNQGLAGKINITKRLFTGKWNVDIFSNYQFVQKEFRTIERLFNIEFDRDWNLNTVSGNQSLSISGLTFTLPKKGTVLYQFENLNFSDSFSGNRHIVNAAFTLSQWNLQNHGSFLRSNGILTESKFIREHAQARYNFGKNWVGGTLGLEDNRETIKSTNQLSTLSQKYTELGTFIGRGDSTKVYMELGYLNRVNDSVQNGALQRVNTSQSYYIKSKLIQNDKTDLSVFINYRNLKFRDPARGNEPSLNSRILYNTRFFDQLIQTTTAYENTSGTIAQQEFTYLQVEPTRGIYMWNDYNGNGVQELNEFEIAPFPDQAIFLRIFLPNQIFIKTHQNKFSEAVTLNPTVWQNANGFKKLLSYFYNQTSYLIDRKIKREGDNFDLNPFSSSDENLLGLSKSFRNSLFFNRGKQVHSITYTYLNSAAKNLLSLGSQENKNSSHQLQYQHLLKKTWLLGMSAKIVQTETIVENYAARNYLIDAYQLAPKISYVFSRNASWDLFYEYQNKENKIGELEKLKQTRVGTSFTYASEKKLSASGEFSMYRNDFAGNETSPVAFQMLEGLQPGKNLVWRLLLQKNLTQYLDINVNYQGRKSETSQAIHTGSVQLRAYF